MDTDRHSIPANVAVIGAGPAGLFAARELAQQGAEVFLLNRDIKPGGLAEYGIYPRKTRMKDGLRSQFRQLLQLPNIHYYGNLTVGQTGDLTLPDLREMGFDGLLVTVGAQGTRRLGIPGEDLRGVYHAKELVYHYNHLPPFAEKTYEIGRRVAIIGVGNVMLDITRWLLEECTANEVIAVARRGPAEVKFDRKELETVVGYLDLPGLHSEIRRVEDQMRTLGQNPRELTLMIKSLLEKTPTALATAPCGSFGLRFLALPARILGDGTGGVRGLEIEETRLARDDFGEVIAERTGVLRTLDVDTVVFAIGDQVDASLGLPVERREFVINPQPRFPIDGVSYEAFDSQAGRPIEDVFVAGWARKASTGVVGLARRDGANGAKALLEYLATRQPSGVAPEAIQAALRAMDKPLVTLENLLQLQEIERERAMELGAPEFYFENNAQMLAAMGLAHESPTTAD